MIHGTRAATVERLRRYAEAEAAHVASLTVRVEELRANGVDTSTFKAPSPQSPDETLAQARARAERARADLAAA